MPTYQYRCSNCSHEFEESQSIKDMSLLTCPECNQEMLNRVIGLGGGMIFKGSGFYHTDYKNGGPSKKEPSSNNGTPAEKKAATAADTPSTSSDTATSEKKSSA